MKRRNLLVLAVGLCAGLQFATVALAQGRIEGRVTDQEGAGIGGISVVSGTVGTITDARGDYALAVAPGTHDVTFSSADFVETATAIEVAATGTTRLDRTLDWQLSVSETITVTSASRRVERITDAPAAVTVVSEEQIARSAAHGQLPKLVEFTPGVEVTQSGLYDYNLNTRGFNSSLNRRVATLIDGRDPAVPFLASQEWSAVSFPLDDIAQAELVRGPSAALYGANASSGVLNLITKAPRDSEGVKVRLSAGELETFNADLRWAGQIHDQWYGKAQGGLRQSGDFSVSRNGQAEYSVRCPSPQGAATDCLPQEAVPLNPLDDDQITFGSLRADRYYTNGAVLAVEGGMVQVEGPAFQTGIGRVQLLDVDRRWERLSLTLAHWNLLASHNARDADRQRSLATGANLALDDRNWRGEIQTNWDLFDGRGRVVGGISYKDERITSVDNNGPVRRTLANLNNQQTLLFESLLAEFTAVYAQFEWTASDRVKLVIAGRYDDSSLHQPQYSPKASLVFSPHQNHTLRFTYNEAFQVPNYSEYFLQADVGRAINLSRLEQICFLDGVLCGFDLDFAPGEDLTRDTTADTRILALGNANLELEEVKTAEIGYSGLLGGKAFLTLDYYYNQNENFITDLLPQLGTALGRVNPTFGAYQAPSTLSPAARTQLFAALAAALGPSRALLSNNLDGTPILAAVSYTNFGKVDTQGVDLGLNIYFTPAWSLQASGSWFDFEIKDSQPGLDRLLLPNSPELKGSFGLAYTGSRFDASVSYRWVDDFRWVVGPFQGNVPSYGTADVVVNFQLNKRWGIGVNVANALDEEHFESFGGDLLGRRALGSVSFTW
jgi:outer membrane receptor for ferrienterochelin and colicins